MNGNVLFPILSLVVYEKKILVFYSRDFRLDEYYLFFVKKIGRTLKKTLEEKKKKKRFLIRLLRKKEYIVIKRISESLLPS